MFAAVAAGALVGAPAAQAHVTLQPKQFEAGSFARVNVRVPNQDDKANTTTIRVQFPPGFLGVLRAGVS